MIKIYIAHEYGRRHGLSDEECEKNVNDCIKNFVRPLIEMGYNPFVPLLHHYIHKNWDSSPDETLYFDLVAEWIKYCDIFLVAKIPEWEGTGVLREVRIANFYKMPVIYSLAELECLKG